MVQKHCYTKMRMREYSGEMAVKAEKNGRYRFRGRQVFEIRVGSHYRCSPRSEPGLRGGLSPFLWSSSMGRRRRPWTSFCSVARPWEHCSLCHALPWERCSLCHAFHGNAVPLYCPSLSSMDARAIIHGFPPSADLNSELKRPVLNQK
jgi:hypothetical protein